VTGSHLLALAALLFGQAGLASPGVASAGRDEPVAEDGIPFPAIDSRQIAAVGIYRGVMSGPISLRTADGGGLLISAGRATRPVWGPYCPLGHDDAIAVVQALGSAVPLPAGSPGGFIGNLLVVITLTDGRRLDVRAPARGAAPPVGLELDGRQYLLDSAKLEQLQDIADRTACVRSSISDLRLP
jgi:hypothetical protein